MTGGVQKGFPKARFWYQNPKSPLRGGPRVPPEARFSRSQGLPAVATTCSAPRDDGLLSDETHGVGPSGLFPDNQGVTRQVLREPHDFDHGLALPVSLLDRPDPGDLDPFGQDPGP